MLFTIAIWFIISLIVIAAGLSLAAFISRFLHYDIKSISSVLMLGLVGSTVYAEYVSIFYKLDKFALLAFVFLIGGG